MSNRPLDFEFLPRRVQVGWRVGLLLGGLVLLLAAAAWLQGEAKIDALEASRAELARQLNRTADTHIVVAPALGEDLARSRRLLFGSLEPRLLELEHCVVDGPRLIGLRHAETGPETKIEMVVDEPGQLGQVLSCLNAGDAPAADGRWVLRALEAQGVGGNQAWVARLEHAGSSAASRRSGP